MDVIICPVVLIIFGLVAHTDGLSIHGSSDAPTERETAAFALLLSVG